jgi:sugar phosphate isomerase/epimerase
MKTALFTVSFAGLWGQHQLTLEESIDKTATLGFEGIEIMGKRPHFSVLDYDLEKCKVLREQIDKSTLQVPAIAAYTNFTGGMEAAEVPFVEMQIEYVTELARRAQILGCDLIRIFTSYENNRAPLSQQWDTTVKAIRECCRRAEEFSVSIGVQNHHDLGIDTKSYQALLQEVDCANLIPMYDCWSLHLRGEDIAAGVRQLAPSMKFTTVADYIILPRWQYQPLLVNYIPLDPPLVRAVPMGEGDIDYATFFETLQEENFDGWVSYEMCSPLRGGGALENLETYTRKFLAYMKNYT